MNLEHRKFYGVCNKYNMEASVEIEFLVDKSCEGISYIKNKIEHCSLPAHNKCRREQCSIWLKANTPC